MDESLAEAVDTRRWLRVAMICGVIGVTCYSLAIWGSLPFRVSYLTFFAFGPFMIAGVVALYRYLGASGAGVALQLGTVFLVCAGVTVTQMATMQGFIRGHYYEIRDQAETEADRALVRERFLAVDSTQQGLDMAFDIFVSSGTFLFALSLLRHPAFGAWFAWPGMLVAVTGLFLNAISFPTVNAGEAGYIDPAPFFGTYFGALSLKLVWEWMKVERAARVDSHA